MTESDDARRANQRANKNPLACPECYGDVWLPSGYLPHSPDCTKGQDVERAALARVGAPFPVADGLLDSPFCDDEDTRRRMLFRAGVYVPKPKDEDAFGKGQLRGEKKWSDTGWYEVPSLVEESNRHERENL